MNDWLDHKLVVPVTFLTPTSHIKFEKLKGSIGHNFLISVLIELTLGHLCYSLTDVHLMLSPAELTA